MFWRVGTETMNTRPRQPPGPGKTHAAFELPAQSFTEKLLCDLPQGQWALLGGLQGRLWVPASWGAGHRGRQHPGLGCPGQQVPR